MFPVVVSVLITNSEDQVLLSMRKTGAASGILGTPGGKAEVGEPLVHAAARELLEEIGASAVIHLEDIFTWQERFKFGSHYFVFYVHLPASRLEGSVINMEPEKHGEWEWFPLDKLNQENCIEPESVLRALQARFAAY